MITLLLNVLQVILVVILIIMNFRTRALAKQLRSVIATEKELVAKLRELGDNL